MIISSFKLILVCLIIHQVNFPLPVPQPAAQGSKLPECFADSAIGLNNDDDDDDEEEEEEEEEEENDNNKIIIISIIIINNLIKKNNNLVQQLADEDQ